MGITFTLKIKNREINLLYSFCYWYVKFAITINKEYLD